MTTTAGAHQTGRGNGGLRTAARLTALDLRLLIREPGVIVGLLAFPAVTVLILAGVFGSVPDPEFAGVRPNEHYVIGYMGVVIAQMGLVTLPAHIATHRELGVLRRYRASGVGAGAMVARRILEKACSWPSPHPCNTASLRRSPTPSARSLPAVRSPSCSARSRSG